MCVYRPDDAQMSAQAFNYSLSNYASVIAPVVNSSSYAPSTDTCKDVQRQRRRFHRLPSQARNTVMAVGDTSLSTIQCGNSTKYAVHGDDFLSLLLANLKNGER